MKEKRYKLEILWENGGLTETAITETELELLEKYGGEFIVMKYYLKGQEDVKPVSFQVWNKEDEPLFPVEQEAVPA